MKYAGFWRRLGSSIIDFLIFFPLYQFAFDECITFKSVLINSVIISALFIFYMIYFHGRWGQTIGKMLMKIRVTDVEGKPISWNKSFYRFSVDIGFSIFLPIIEIFSLLSISSTRKTILCTNGDSWLDYTYYLWLIWILSELVVLLFNKKKRAIHDFIAGTVVVHNQSTIMPDSELTKYQKNRLKTTLLFTSIILFMMFSISIISSEESNQLPVKVDYSISPNILVGDMASLKLIVENKYHKKILFDGIDLPDQYIKSFEQINIAPTPSKSANDEDSFYYYWTLNKTLEPNEKIELIISFESKESGVFLEEIDLTFENFFTKTISPEIVIKSLKKK